MRTYSTQPTFLDSAQGKIFAIQYKPHQPILGNVVFVPPFAEEMNRCRPMMTRQARMLAGQGYNSIVFDLYGTGDSWGDFGEATWSCWERDLQTVQNSSLIIAGHPLSIVGIRLGAALALKTTSKTGRSAEVVVLWNPVFVGKTHMTQFLRLQLASSMVTNVGNPESVSEIRSTLTTTKFVEIAGYELSQQLVAEIDAIQIRNIGETSSKVSIIDVADQENPTPSFIARKFADQSRAAGSEIEVLAVEGAPFWSTQEISIAPNLLSATIDRIAHDK